jgi:hypothetical protein
MIKPKCDIEYQVAIQLVAVAEAAGMEMSET